MGTPEVIQNCEPIFRKFIDPQIRNTLLTDIVGFSSQALDASDDEDLPLIVLKSVSYLPDSLKDCILKRLGYLPTSASTLSMLTVSGITYSVASKHRGNSCILLDSPSFLPAQIEHIVQFVCNHDSTSVNTLVAVRRFQQLNDHSDPFLIYPLLRTQIWSGELGALELYPVNAIQCHFACSTMLWKGEQVKVMVSLSRVRPHFLSFQSIVTKKFRRYLKCSTYKKIIAQIRKSLFISLLFTRILKKSIFFLSGRLHCHLPH
jgi:hypothetical protein